MWYTQGVEGGHTRVGVPGSLLPWVCVYQAPYYPGCIPAMYLRVYTRHVPQGVYPAWSSGCIPSMVLRVYSHQGVPQGVFPPGCTSGCVPPAYTSGCVPPAYTSGWVSPLYMHHGGYPRCICTMVGMYLSGMHNGGYVPLGYAQRWAYTSGFGRMWNILTVGLGGWELLSLCYSPCFSHLSARFSPFSVRFSPPDGPRWEVGTVLKTRYSLGCLRLFLVIRCYSPFVHRLSLTYGVLLGFEGGLYPGIRENK